MSFRSTDDCGRPTALRAGRQNFATPSCFEPSPDWRCERWNDDGRMRPGPVPHFFDFVCLRACHWLVDVNAWVATKVEPGRAWQVLTSDRHSTLWDGRRTLFDLNYVALGISVAECWALAAGRYHSRIVPLAHWVSQHIGDHAWQRAGGERLERLSMTANGGTRGDSNHRASTRPRAA